MFRIPHKQPQIGFKWNSYGTKWIKNDSAIFIHFYYFQKKWSQSDHKESQCEPCNCHEHSNKCVYDPEIDEQHLSLDIHGNYEGGGRCLECQHNTEGINCNKCKSGFYRPAGKLWNETDVCQCKLNTSQFIYYFLACICDPKKHTQNCAEETGQCECLPQFTGPNCKLFFMNLKICVQVTNVLQDFIMNQSAGLANVM